MSFHIGWPQGIYLFLLAFGLVATAADFQKDDISKKKLYSSIASVILTLGLLWWGGFFG